MSTSLRQSIRRLYQRPVHSLTAILALAFGICLAAVGFAGFDVALFSNLPFDDDARFVRFQIVGKDGVRGLDADLYGILRSATNPTDSDPETQFVHVGAFGGDRFNLRHDSGEVESVVGALLTPSTFAQLPYVPLVGRHLVPDDGLPGAEPVVVIRESLWQRWYDADPGVPGKRLEVAGVSRTIVGVLPDDAGFPTGGELWLPLNETNPGGVGALGLAVLRSDATLTTARSHVDLAVRQVEAEKRSLGSDEFELRASLSPFTQPPPGAAPVLGLFVAGLLALLLVVAANLANLVLAQTSARAGELAVRSALGASRWRLVGEIFLDVLLLGAVAATLALVVARQVLAFLDHTLDEKPFWAEFSLNLPTLAFVALCTISACAVAGALPALRATQAATGGNLRSGLGVSFGFGRVGATLTVVEMALSVGLLSTALVLANGLSRHGELMLGFPHEQILTAYVTHSAAGDESTRANTGSLVRAAERTPLVMRASVASHVPGVDAPLQQVSIDGGSSTGEALDLRLPVAAVDRGFFAVLGASSSSGRIFRESDFSTGEGEYAPRVVVVNEPFVARYLGSRNPIGLELRWSPSGRPQDEHLLRIVGVVPDLGLSASDSDTAAGLYVPIESTPRWSYLVLRTEGQPSRAEQPLRRAMLDLDPTIQLRHVQPLGRVGWDERAFFSGLGTALLGMGSMAMLLSLLALYATASLTMSKRRREIGVRVALGAGTRQILRLVIGQAIRFVTAGGVLGTGLAFLLLEAQGKMFVTRLPVEDPGIVPIVATVLAMAALAACWSPARGALRVPPSEALRADS
ncbi:MAG: ABC transporter permease [Thermoanaerobaculia bacterium]|nr:ABC transporter permease [Thermoanaerobaculia bacterium]